MATHVTYASVNPPEEFVVSSTRDTIRTGNVLVVAVVSSKAVPELPVTVLPALLTNSPLAPISVIAKSPIVVPLETTATLKSISGPSAT